MTKLPTWAQPADLATTVEFARFVQSHLSTSALHAGMGTDHPTVVEVIEFVGEMVRQFQDKYRDVEWGEDGYDWMECSEQFFDAADKPDWW